MTIALMVSVVSVASLVACPFAYKMIMLRNNWGIWGVREWLLWSMWMTFWFTDWLFVLFFSFYACTKLFNSPHALRIDPGRGVEFLVWQISLWAIPSIIVACIFDRPK